MVPSFKNNISCDPIFINRGCEPLFHYPILLLIFQVPHLKTQLQPNKTLQNCKSVPIFIIWGSFSNREKRLYNRGVFSMSGP